eukprot:2741617-Prymnesium_polylepis.2
MTGCSCRAAPASHTSRAAACISRQPRPSRPGMHRAACASHELQSLGSCSAAPPPPPNVPRSHPHAPVPRQIEGKSTWACAAHARALRLQGALLRDDTCRTCPPPPVGALVG